MVQNLKEIFQYSVKTSSEPSLWKGLVTITTGIAFVVSFGETELDIFLLNNTITKNVLESSKTL